MKLFMVLIFYFCLVVYFTGCGINQSKGEIQSTEQCTDSSSYFCMPTCRGDWSRQSETDRYYYTEKVDCQMQENAYAVRKVR